MGMFIIALALFFATGASAQTGNKFGVPPTYVPIIGAIGMPLSTVAGLPVCDRFLTGVIRGVTDASAPTFGSILAGGGAVHALAYCNGTNWTAR